MKAATLKARPFQPIATPAPAAPPATSFALSSPGRTVLIACLGAAAVAYLLPFPATKVALGTALGLLFMSVSIRHFYIALALFAFVLPLQTLLPTNSFLIRGLNIQTMFVLGYCVLAGIAGSQAEKKQPQPAIRNVFARPLIGFLCVMLLSAVHSSLATSVPDRKSVV